MPAKLPLRDAERRLRAVMGSVESLLAAVDSVLTFPGCAPEPRGEFGVHEIKPYFREYAEVRSGLRSADPSRFAGIPACLLRLPDPGWTTVSRPVVEALLRAVKHALVLLPDEAPISDVVRKEGFFFRNQRFEALLAATGIIESATSSVGIIDRFAKSNVLGLLESTKGKCSIQILTGKADESLRTIAKAFNKDGGRLEIRLSDEFHDRFIIVDGREFYHFGTSLAEAGTRGFMYSRIEEPPVIDALQRTFASVWEKAGIAVAYDAPIPLTPLESHRPTSLA